MVPEPKSSELDAGHCIASSASLRVRSAQVVTVAWRLQREAIARKYLCNTLAVLITDAPGDRQLGHASSFETNAMNMPFSCYNVFLSQAKRRSKAQAIKLAEAQELLSREYGFLHFHELTAVAKRNPMERRLMVAALGVADLADTIYQNDVQRKLADEVAHQLTAATAETNAEDFSIENESVDSAVYDDQTGKAILELSFSWSGTHIPDRMWTGREFHLQARLSLLCRDRQWSVANEGLEILQCISDQEYQDRQDELEQRKSAVTLAEALADQLGLTVEEAEELENTEAILNESSDNQVYGWHFNFENEGSETLRAKLGEMGRLTLRVGPNFFDNIKSD